MCKLSVYQAMHTAALRSTTKTTRYKKSLFKIGSLQYSSVAVISRDFRGTKPFPDISLTPVEMGNYGRSNTLLKPSTLSS